MVKIMNKRKNGFTLVELLAVIVILAIILVIAVPKITNTIESSKLSGIESTAKVILTSTKEKLASKLVLDENYESSYMQCSDIVELSENDYYKDTCFVTFTNDNVASISLRGKGKFDGYICTGDIDNLVCKKSDKCMLTFIPNVINERGVAYPTINNYEVECGTSVTFNNEKVYIGEEKIVEIGNTLSHKDDELPPTMKWRKYGETNTLSDEITIDSHTAFIIGIGGCVIEGTKITMGDGTLKNIEDISPNDLVLTYDIFSGKLLPYRVVTVLEDSALDANVFEIKLDNGSSISIVDYEYLFDMNERKYLLVDINTYKQLVGKKVMINDNGNIGSATITSVSYEKKYSKYYTMYVENSNNYVANNIIARIGTYWVNDIFEINEDYKIDYEKLNNDIQLYGLYSYEDLKDYTTYDVYEKLNYKYAKFIEGKGIASWVFITDSMKMAQEEIEASLERFK